MDLIQIRCYCLAKPGTSESFPFDESVLAFKVMDKIFALTNIDVVPVRINLKADPDEAIDLRESYQEITPGYHMNKKHWITVACMGRINMALLQSLIDRSYGLVAASLPKASRAALAELKGP